jgi:hypothetical protein
MKQLIWKLMPMMPMQNTQVVWRELEDGKQESCLVTAPEYLAWLAEGNTPIAADETIPDEVTE